MHGNVWEWCWDEFHDSYSEKPARLKSNGNEPWGELKVVKEDNRAYICRGGSWFNDAIYCRSAYRRWFYARTLAYGLGFRVVFGSSSPGLS
jgi:formylglycine-generating enzyme required for sulfatase activity